MVYGLIERNTRREVVDEANRLSVSIFGGIPKNDDGFCALVSECINGSSTETIDQGLYDRNTVAYLLDRCGRKDVGQEFFDSNSEDTIESILGLPDKSEALGWFKEFGVPETATVFGVTSRALFNAYDFTHKELRVAAGYSEQRTELTDGVAQGLGLNDVIELKTLLGHYSGELNVFTPSD